MITDLNWASHYLEIYYISLEFFAFHISTISFQIFFFLSSNLLTFSPFYSLYAEKNRNNLMEITSTSCQQIFKPTCSCTHCPYFLPVIIRWRHFSSFQGLSFPLPACYPLLLPEGAVFPHYFSNFTPRSSTSFPPLLVQYLERVIHTCHPTF